MANLDQLEILKQGPEVWNKWRAEKPFFVIDLSEEYLSYAILVGADLSSVNLKGTDLTGAYLSQANLKEADLSQADLSMANLESADLSNTKLNNAILWRANLYEANLRSSTLRGADLRGTDLMGADLRGADLTSSNFRMAEVGDTNFENSDLSAVLGLEDLLYRGPSHISRDTFVLSKGNIPKKFLRGCGLRDWEIESVRLYQPGLDPKQVTDITYNIHQLYLGGGIQFYSCFISYNSKDEDFAKQLHDDLQNKGVRCWFAPEDMKIGDQIRSRIDQEIRLRDKLLVILSENSVKSEWVGDEVEGALEEESKSNHLVLFPIRLDDAVMNTREDWAAKIKRRRHIGDFSNWKDKTSYQKAFERLLRDLKATGVETNGE